MFVNAPPGLLFPGDAGVPQYGLNSSMKNFAPRAGFAYDVTGDGKTSILGGFGTFYDAMQNGIYNNRFVDVTPFSTQVNLTAPSGSFSDPYRGFAGGNPFPAPYPLPQDIKFQTPLLARYADRVRPPMTAVCSRKFPSAASPSRCSSGPSSSTCSTGSICSIRGGRPALSTVYCWPEVLVGSIAGQRVVATPLSEHMR
jgi:hypothetical protein